MHKPSTASRQPPSWHKHGVGAQEVPPLTEKILATDGCWEQENEFLSEMVPLKGYPYFSRWPYTAVSIDST